MGGREEWKGEEKERGGGNKWEGKLVEKVRLIEDATIVEGKNGGREEGGGYKVREKGKGREGKRGEIS